jgi:Na+-transporting NADH:ubiquinone oxidoreductase subunit NqrE
MLEKLSNLTLAAIVTAMALVAFLMTCGVLTVSERMQVAYIGAQERGAVLPR